MIVCEVTALNAYCACKKLCYLVPSSDHVVINVASTFVHEIPKSTTFQPVYSVEQSLHL